MHNTDEQTSGIRNRFQEILWSTLIKNGSSLAALWLDRFPAWLLVGWRTWLLCDLLPGMEAIKGLSWIQSLLPMRLLHHWDNFRGSTSISSFCQEAAGKNKTTRVPTLQKRCYKQSDGRKHRPSHKLSSIHTTRVYVQIDNIVLCQ